MTDVKKGLEEIQRLMGAEDETWKELGMSLDMIGGLLTPEKFYYAVMKLDALITFLLKKELVDKDELELHHKTRLYTGTKQIREALQDEFKAQKTRADIAVPTKPILYGPDGNPII